MTVSSQTSRIEQLGNGTTTAFAVNFYFLENSDLKVFVNGVLQTITTNYTVSGAGNPAGGTVTFVTAPANGFEVVIFRDPALTQGLDYIDNDPFPAESHERGLDKLTMIAQRVKDLVSRALRLGDSVVGVNTELPALTGSQLLGTKPDGTGFQLYPLGSEPDTAGNIVYTPAGTGAVSTTVETKLRESVSVKDFGAVGDGVADDTAALQAAIDFASTNAINLYFNPGVYRHTSTLVWKNGAHYYSDNVNSSNTKGAVLVYTGINDANVINNPLNSSTFASIRIEGITFLCNALSSGKALFYDTGSTYLYIKNCKFNFSGADSFGLVFHQTEVSTIEKCIFEALDNIGLGATIRLADGPVLKHPTADVGYTNRITITDNQINPALGGAQAIGLWDDGGLVHTIKDNNFNGGSISIYLLNPYPVEISSNEIEGYTTAGISCALAGAGLTGLRIVGNYLLAVPSAIAFANNSIAELTYTDNVISVLGGGPCETNISGSPNAKIFAANNREVSAGNNPFNTYLQLNVDTVGSMLLAGSGTAGVQSYTQNTMTWRRIGDVVFFNVYIALSAKDAATAGNINLTGLPFPHRSANAQITSLAVAYMSDITLTAGYTQLSAIVQPGNSFIQLVQGGSGQPVSFLPASAIVATSQIMVSGMYPI